MKRQKRKDISRQREQDRDDLSRAYMLVALGVLIEAFEFTPEQLEYFVEYYAYECDRVDAGLDTAESIAEHIYNYSGIKVVSDDN